MKNFNITNPVYNDLLKLNLVDPKNIKLFHNKTRDGKYNVLIDDASGIIFLEENNISIDHYTESPGAGNFNEYFNKNGYYEDDLRRFKLFEPEILKSDYILDVGSEWGGFIKLAKKQANRIDGVEPNQKALSFVEKHLKIKVYKDIKLVNDEPDLITMFHVLEHISNQLEFLKTIFEKMKPGGRIVVEVPHANDFLIKELLLPEFRDFTFWNEHLVLHTEESLNSILKSVGFNEIKISHIQRYGFLNHFGWIYDKKPGGHIRYAQRYDDKLNNSYCSWLEKSKTSDTLICIAYKPI